jgi:HTH-type transcriptional regulator / antitoxin HipB
MDQIARTPKQIGAALQRRRKTLGLSQQELGDRAALRQSTVSFVENGDADAKLSTLLDIMASLGLEFVIRERTRSSTEIEDIF